MIERSEREVLERLQYSILRNTFYRGVKTAKNPMDAWKYQEMIHKIRPDLIIEIGTNRGGSALFLADCCQLAKHGDVLTIDIREMVVSDLVKDHPRIHRIIGDANDPDILESVSDNVFPPDRLVHRVMVIEDSSHTYENTLAVLNNYSLFVTVDSYFVVEDTVGKYRPLATPVAPGDAVEAFLETESGKSFVIDQSWDAYSLSWNPNGWLKRIDTGC